MVVWYNSSMNIKYIITDPTGNLTALVTTPVDRQYHKAVGSFIMQQNLSIEQVGFLTDVEDAPNVHLCSLTSPALSLTMAGGEFCGHATLSAAAYAAKCSGQARSATEEITILSSGTTGPVTASITNLSDDGSFYVGRLSMPLPVNITCYPYDTKGPNGIVSLPVVNFPGISHMIVSNQFMTEEDAESQIREIASGLGINDLGIMLIYDNIDFESDNQELFMKPLVLAGGADTLIWEHGCASGASAVGAYMASLASITHNKKAVSVHITQPGGFLTVNVSCDDFEISELSIVGQVRFVSSEECSCPLIG